MVLMPCWPPPVRLQVQRQLGEAQLQLAALVEQRHGEERQAAALAVQRAAQVRRAGPPLHACLPACA